MLYFVGSFPVRNVKRIFNNHKATTTTFGMTIFVGIFKMIALAYKFFTQNKTKLRKSIYTNLKS